MKYESENILLEIKELIQNINTNCFEVVVTAMHGDGDRYEYINIGLFNYANPEHMKLLEELIYICEWAFKYEYPDVYEFYKNYDWVMWFNYDSYCLWNNQEKNEFNLPEKDIRYNFSDGYWPINEFGIPATFNNYEVIYYDHFGNKHKVHVTLSKED